MYKSTIHGGLAPRRLAGANYRRLVTRRADRLNKEASSGHGKAAVIRAVHVNHCGPTWFYCLPKPHLKRHYEPHICMQHKKYCCTFSHTVFCLKRSVAYYHNPWFPHRNLHWLNESIIFAWRKKCNKMQCNKGNESFDILLMRCINLSKADFTQTGIETLLHLRQNTFDN